MRCAPHSHVHLVVSTGTPSSTATSLSLSCTGAGVGHSFHGIAEQKTPRAVFWEGFETLLLVTLEPNAGHTNFPDFLHVVS